MTLSAGVTKRSVNMPWSAIGAIGASAIGAFGSAYAANKAYKYQKKLMNHQYNLTRQLNQNAYQDTTYSMRQSGINPMLAITQGVNGLSAGSGGSVNVQNPAEAGNSSYALHKQVKNETKLRESQEKLNDSQGSLNRNTEELQNRQGLNVEANTAYVQSQKNQLDTYGPLKAQAEINQINAGSAKLLNDMKNSNAITASQVGLNVATTQQILQNTKSSKIDTDWSTEHPILYGLGRSGSAIPVVGAIGAGIAGASAMQYRQKELDLRTRQFEQSSKVKPRYSRRH